MRKSKKTKSVEKFRIRRCVVRLQRMKTQPITTRSATAKGPAPLKKRPLTGAITSTPASSTKAKERLKTPIMQRGTKIVQLKKPPTPVVEDLPPTIAAGRSRRAHKPNPKYASEDMVTPKILKSNRKDNDSDGKNRRSSLSSLDDFFNDDSSEEELEEEDTDDTEDDKKYKTSKRTASDSDFADTNDDSDDGSVKQKKRPGRPKKQNKIELPSKRPIVVSSTSNILNKSAPATKTITTTKNTPNLRNPPSQLQQLRRTFGATTVSPLSLGRKRKIEEGGRESLPLAPKRFVLSTGAPKSVMVSNVVTRRSSPNQALNGSKTSTPATQTQKREIISSSQEKKMLPAKTLLNVINTKTASQTKLLQSQHKTMSTQGTAAIANVKATAPKPIPSNRQNSTPAFAASRGSMPAPKPKAPEIAKERVNRKVDETTKEPIIDDFETMPTFTIVNINDIINKKGDVLISKTPVKKSVPDRSKVLAIKTSPEQLKSTQFRTSTPLVRKPPEKPVNNNATINKHIGKNLSTSSTPSPAIGGGNAVEKKPAPRILNSVVGRKTKPVKPMIANLDISTESPSCSLSLYDDEEDEDIDDDSKIDGSSSNETETLDATKHIQSKLYSAGVTTKSKSSEPKTAAKENSLAATNMQPHNQSKVSDSRKLSPEKVIVSRQGNKIIKKITCFETWYVINIPAETPEEYERNNLSMPLTQLANATKTIKLPSEMWTTKVTLYELSASTLSKSNVIPYTGDITEQNIAEEDRYKYQPSCVMFRRTVTDRSKSQLPYDRAVIFKNKTFFTNIEGKNVKLVGAPSTISQITEIETLLYIVDSLTLQSSLVEPAATVT